MGLKIDKSRNYGTVVGHPDIAYEQDGHHFRHDGTLYEESIAPVQSQTLKLPEKRDGLR